MDAVSPYILYGLSAVRSILARVCSATPDSDPGSRKGVISGQFRIRQIHTIGEGCCGVSQNSAIADSDF